MRYARSLAVGVCFGLLSLLPGCESGQDRFALPFVKYTLDNGLDVILHQDHSDPIVAVAIVVHVGSNREKPGKTGFAHFFEHMSFNDSENVPRGANRKMIGELGGTRNGGTWNDGTMYYEVVPKDALEKLMWIDSDRLGYMINTVTEDALENEKQVVKNEKRQRVDNRAYGHTQEVTARQLYPPEHPYSWTVIGSLADLEAATLDDVREFYERYYGAENATLAIAGDIDIEETKTLVQKWFGEIRRGPVVLPLGPLPATLRVPKSLYHVDNFAKLPELRMVFHTVEEFHPDSYALDALGGILSDGKRAPLYRTIVEERKLAPGVSALNSSQELAGTFTIRVRANAGVDLDEVKTAIEAALAGFEKDAFLERDLARIKSLEETAFYENLSSVLDKALAFAQYNEFAADPGFAGEKISRIQAVSREDVKNVYERYIKDKPYVMTAFVPKGQEQLIVEGAVRAEVFEEQVIEGAEKTVTNETLTDYERTPAKFDRSVEPPLGPPPLFSLPEIGSVTAANGMRILHIEHRELPLVEFALRIRGGQLVDPPGKWGVAALLGDLLQEGTRNRTPEALEDAIGELGAEISIETGQESIEIRAGCLVRSYREVLALMREMLLEPRWDAKEFERLKSATLTRIEQREGDPDEIAMNAFNRVLYGEGHVFSVPVSGTRESVAAIELADLQAYYAENFSPTVSAFHLAGAIGRDELVGSLRDLTASFKPKEVVFPRYALPEPPTKPTVYFIDVPGSKQSVIRIGRLALQGADEDYNNLSYANNRLGDGSSARLFQLLRIEKGYTYGAGSWIPRSREMAPFIASSSVRANVTLESLQLLKEQLQGYRETFLEEDLETTRNILTKRATREFETLGDLLDVLRRIGDLDLPLDFVERDQRELGTLSLEALRETIGTYIDESRMIYLIVGDAETQLARLDGLGYGEPVLLDVTGRPRDR